MKDMQTKILDHVNEAITEAGFEPVIRTAYGNTGKVYAMSGLATVAGFSYQFSDSYCSLDHLVGDWQPEEFAGANGANGGGWHYLEYTDSERLVAFMHALVDAIIRASDEAVASGG